MTTNAPELRTLLANYVPAPDAPGERIRLERLSHHCTLAVVLSVPAAFVALYMSAGSDATLVMFAAALLLAGLGASFARHALHDDLRWHNERFRLLSPEETDVVTKLLCEHPSAKAVVARWQAQLGHLRIAELRVLQDGIDCVQRTVRAVASESALRAALNA